jgi:hypothetical protein
VVLRRRELSRGARARHAHHWRRASPARRRCSSDCETRRSWWAARPKHLGRCIFRPVIHDVLCHDFLFVAPPRESKGGGRAIGLLFPPVQLSGRGETEVLMEVSSWRLVLLCSTATQSQTCCAWPAFFVQFS